MATRKLRLLCLHGMYQDAATFSAKTKPLRGPVASGSADFLFVDGPFTIVPPILNRQSKRPSASNRVRCAKKKTEFRCWWRLQQDEASDLQDRNVLVHFLRDKLDEVGDVDGVVGFSQGASLAAWMCSQQAQDELQWTPKMAVLIGSYLGSPHFSLDSGVLPDVASLHMFGSNDYVIPAAKSQQVADLFKQVQTREDQVLISTHSQGHVIPKCDSSRQAFETFVDSQQTQLLGAERDDRSQQACAL